MPTTYTFSSLPQEPNDTIARKFAGLYREAIRAIFLDEGLMLQATDLLATPTALQKALCGQNYLICIAPNAMTGATTLEEGQWVGIYGVVGPLQTGQSTFFEADAPSLSAESLWFSRRMYVQEQHRKHEAIMGLHEAADRHIRERHQATGLEAGHARLRFFAKDGSASSALHLANAGQVDLIRPISYMEILQGDGNLGRLPHVLVQAAPARVLEMPWKMFEMRLRCGAV